MRIHLGLGVFQHDTPDALIRTVRRAEELGYESFWYANEKLYRDHWIGLTVAALNSRRLVIGTYVTDPYTQHPALMAAAAATLDELSGGRTILMIGAGGASGVPLALGRRQPALAIREAILVIRRLLAGERVTFEGETVRLLDGHLHLPARKNLPIYVASRGNLILELAGEVADGVMIATYATPRGVQHALSRIDRGLARSGRTWQDVRIISRVDVAIHPDRRVAREAVRTMIAGSLTTSYPDTGFVRAVGLELSPELQAMAARKDREHSQANAHLVPDEMVDAFTWTGTPEDVAGRVAEIVRLGISHVTVMFHPTDAVDEATAIRLMAEQITPMAEAMTGGT
ncbi:MAG: LLM class flavin-dependent oxidoreductase [Chloroflexi bacterium]|nr:LLM class flavin-dependent oxidoreductase [Chloroflexota bacterium]